MQLQDLGHIGTIQLVAQFSVIVTGSNTYGAEIYIIRKIIILYPYVLPKTMNTKIKM